MSSFQDSEEYVLGEIQDLINTGKLATFTNANALVQELGRRNVVVSIGKVTLGRLTNNSFSRRVPFNDPRVLKCVGCGSWTDHPYNCPHGVKATGSTQSSQCMDCVGEILERRKCSAGCKCFEGCICKDEMECRKYHDDELWAIIRPN